MPSSDAFRQIISTIIAGREGEYIPVVFNNPGIGYTFLSFHLPRWKRMMPATAMDDSAKTIAT